MHGSKMIHESFANFSQRHFPALCLAILFGGHAVSFAQDDKAPWKVFILAGQSNMAGQGAAGTLDWLGEDPDYGHLLQEIKNEDGSWAEREDVWVYYPRAKGAVKIGKLSVGYGVRDDKIGPELLFGHVMGDFFDNPVLLIKAAWGGRSLAVDFRPPSSGGEVGPNYLQTIQIVRDVLDNLAEHFPAYEGQGYALAGFVWFQGWNDMIKVERNAEYEQNLVNLIKDLRAEFDAPDLPVVIGELGVGGQDEEKANEKKIAFRKAQAAAAARPEFQGTVAFVETSKYWDEEAQTLFDSGRTGNKWTDEAAREAFNKIASQPPYHYLGSGKIYSLIGYGFGEAMKGLCEKE